MGWYVRIAVVWFASIFSASSVLAQTVSTELDRDTIYLSETVILTIEVVDLAATGDSPDVGQLTADFYILDSQSNTQERSIKQQQTTVLQWEFELEAKRAGSLSIPAMKIGQRLRTQPLSLTVLPRQAVELADEIFIEIVADPVDQYVQAQIKYTERLYTAVAIDGRFQRTEVSADLLLERLGEDIPYAAEKNGKRYRVTERNYVIFPQKSGALVLPKLIFKGRVGLASNLRQRLDGNSGLGQRVEIASEPVTLTIRPKPAAYSGEHWLPSERLQMTETWSQDPDQLVVGVPVTRTIVLEAVGLKAEQLPEITLPTIAAATVYPDRQTSQTRHDGTSIIGRREQSIAIIPTAEGVFELPAVRLTWWDTNADAQSQAVIEQRRIQVIAESITTDTPEPVVVTVEQNGHHDIDADLHLPPRETRWQRNGWFALSLLLALSWLVTLLLWWQQHRQRSNHQRAAQNVDQSVSVETAKQAVKTACQQGDAKAVANALLHWGRVCWPQQPPANLAELGARLAGGEVILASLDRAVYGVGDPAWNGRQWWRQLKKLFPADAVVKTAVGLQPLYPSQR